MNRWFYRMAIILPILANIDLTVLQAQSWTDKNKRIALLYANAGANRNVLVLLWKNRGLRVYNSGMCPFVLLDKDKEPETARARDLMYIKIKESERKEVRCALHLIC